MVTPAQEIYSLAWFIHIQKTDEGSLRRCISTAYYAVFRLIIDDGITLLFPHSPDLQRVYARKFTHASIAEICEVLAVSQISPDNVLFNYKELIDVKNPISKTGKNGKSITEYPFQAGLPVLGKTFKQLRQEREIADYDMSEPITTKVTIDDTIQNMVDFFQTWMTVKANNPQALTTLVALFLFGKK